ncbi:MAG: extracellular solute-binding protein [Clostridia bacterium]
MNKKITALVLAFMLVFSLAAPALAAAVMSSSVGSGDSDWIVSVTAVKDTLYLLYGSGKLTSRTLTNAEETELGEAIPANRFNDAASVDAEAVTLDLLFTKEGQPHGLCSLTGSVWRLLDDAGLYAPQKLPVKLDTSAWAVADGEYTNVYTPTNLFLQGQWLYYCGTSFSGSPNSFAGRVNIETGAKQAFQTKNIIGLTPYEDGKLIAYVFDLAAQYSAMTSTAEELGSAGQYGIFDPETDTLTGLVKLTTDSVLGGLSISGFCYGNGSLFYSDASQIKGVDIATGASRVSAYTGSGMYGSGLNNAGTMYVEGYYITFSYDGLSLYKLDSENLKKGALRIFGEFGTNAHKSFMKNYPDIPVDASGEYTNNVEKLTQAMVSDTDAYDVLQLSLNMMPVERLIKKGYCADLSGDAEIVALLQSMYPRLADAVTKDGKIYAVPVECTAYTYGYNTRLWEELGLTEADLPKNLLELYDFAANWVYDYGEDHPDIMLFDYKEARQLSYSLMVTQYFAYTQWKNGEMRFDTPVFRNLLDAFMGINFDDIASAASDVNSDAYYNASGALFTLYQPVGQFAYQSKDMKPLYLSMSADDEPFIAAAVNVLIINPKTQRMDDALLYVKNYVANLDKSGANITLFPDHNDPVPDGNYPKKHDALLKAIDEITARLETVDEEHKAELNENLKIQKENLAELEKNQYTVTAETIANFRQNVAPLLYVQQQNVLYGASDNVATEINTMLMQYLEGAVTTDQLIQTLDQRVKLMQLEDQ